MALRAGSHRLVDLAAETLRITRSAPGRIAGRLLAAGFVIYLAVRLWQLWRRDPVDLTQLSAGAAVLAVTASVVAVTAYGVVWLYVLRRLRVAAPFSWITLFFKSQLGKYIPGSVWQYAGRVGLGRRYGLPFDVGLASIVVEIVASSLAAGVVGLLVLSTWQAGASLASLGAALALAFALRRRVGSGASRLATLCASRVGVNRDLLVRGMRVVPAASARYLLVWFVYGTAFWLTARALFGVPATDVVHYTGTFALAWLAGFAAVFAPGGVGVREAVIVALLRGRLGETHAIVLAASSRLVLTAIDLVAGGLSMSLPALLHGRHTDADPIPGARS